MRSPCVVIIKKRRNQKAQAALDTKIKMIIRGRENKKSKNDLGNKQPCAHHYACPVCATFHQVEETLTMTAHSTAEMSLPQQESIVEIVIKMMEM